MSISRNMTVESTLGIINDYVNNGMSTKKLRVKYHTSPNTVIEILNTSGVMRSKSNAAANQYTNKDKNKVSAFNHVTDDILLNLAKIGLSKRQVADIFGLSNGGRLFHDRLDKIHYSDVRRENSDEWLVNVDSSLKFKVFTNFSKQFWMLLRDHLSIGEMSDMLDVSKSFIRSQFDRLGLTDLSNMHSVSSFLFQNFPNDRHLGDWVYQAYHYPRLFEYLLDCFPGAHIHDVAKFFNHTESQAKLFVNQHGLHVITGDSFGSVYETKVMGALRKVYDGPVIYRDHSVLEGKEIDFYLPEAHLGIEVSPSATHSETGYQILKGYDHNYHYKKRLVAHSKGITLLTLFSNLLSDDYIENQLPILLSQYLQQDQITVDGPLCYKFLSDDVAEKLVAKKNLVRFGSNVLDVIGIFDVNSKLIAYAPISEYTWGSDSVKILGIYSDYSLPFDNDIMKTLIKGIKSKYSTASIYGQTGRMFGTGEYYKNNGFVFDKYQRPREHYFYATRDGELPLSENVIYKNHKSRRELLDEGYVPVFDCGSAIYKYED